MTVITSSRKPSSRRTIRLVIRQAVLGDKGYLGADLVALIEAFEAEAVIPSRKNANKPREIDRELSKIARNYRAFLHHLRTEMIVIE